MQFGIRTASGATLGAEQQFAGGGGRSYVAGRLADGQTILLVSESRATDLFTLTQCSIRETDGVYDAQISSADKPFSFYSVYSGGAAGCRDGHLDGFEVKPDGEDHATVTARRVTISADGRHATTGPRRVILRHASYGTTSDSDKLDRYSRITCSPSRTLSPTVSR